MLLGESAGSNGHPPSGAVRATATRLGSALLDAIELLGYALIDAGVVSGLALIMHGIIWIAERTFDDGGLPLPVQAVETYSLWFVAVAFILDSAVRLLLYFARRVRSIRAELASPSRGSVLEASKQGGEVRRP